VLLKTKRGTPKTFEKSRQQFILKSFRSFLKLKAICIMKNLKVKMAAMALLIGTGAAFASVAPKAFTNKKWGLDRATGLYIDVTGETKGVGYSCTGVSETCTAQFPSDVDPNNQAGDAHPGTVAGTNIEPGVFGQ
jgi:hypothetical protein